MRDACEKRSLTQLFNVPTIGLPKQLCYQPCSHNIVLAAQERHYAPVPVASMSLTKARGMMRSMMRSTGLYPGSLEPWTPEQVVKTRAPAKRRTYRDAYDSFRDKGIQHKDSVVTGMIKFEKHDSSKIKPPRLIQFRSTRYTAHIAQWLAPFEKQFYQARWGNLPVFAKGMNSYQRANNIVAMGGPGRRYLMLDHKQFDGHISVDHLKFEHACYNWVFRDSALSDALKWQLKNRCYTRSGQDWTAVGGRMSGDFNTSLGNNIINLAVLMLWADHLGVLQDTLFFLDGDDSVVSLPDYVVDYQLEYFERYGFEMSIEAEGIVPEDVIFCQTRPVCTGAEWRMTRSYERAVSRMQYTIRTQCGRGWLRYARGVAEAERILGDGLPIFAALGQRLCELIPKVAPLFDNNDYYRMWAEPPYVCKPITSVCRASFSLAWGISATEQRAIEAVIASASLADPLFQLYKLSHG